MSRFIEDQELEEFAQDVIECRPKAIATAMEIFKKIRDHKIYIARAMCNCNRGDCLCRLPFEPDNSKIQAGDTFKQITPGGMELTLGALGVRRPAPGVVEIFTAGWPPAIVRSPDHGVFQLVRKGNGITKSELRHRRVSVGGDWEDGL